MKESDENLVSSLDLRSFAAARDLPQSGQILGALRGRKYPKAVRFLMRIGVVACVVDLKYLNPFIYHHLDGGVVHPKFIHVRCELVRHL